MHLSEMWLSQPDAAGTVEVASIAGAAGGKAVVPVVSVNVLNTVTKAKAAAHNDVSKNMIALTGDMILRAKSSKKRKTVANGKAAGASVAAGGAVSVAAGSMNQYAYMERNLTGANNITVTAESTNSSETTSVAGANGAAAPEEDDSTGSGEDDGESHSKTSPDDLVNKALASGKRAGGGTGNITGTDSKTPQPAETTEGKVTVAAAVSVDIWKDHTAAAVNADTTSTGKLSVDAKAKNDVGSYSKRICCTGNQWCRRQRCYPCRRTDKQGHHHRNPYNGYILHQSRNGR